ncbi:hypothetical protein, partial [Stenotrophomonas maltophilia]|uniref:hypothetical protein n=1 Tax=Stenotrophomonas maltophilia TaxID=40324 RepID=UPI001954F80D
LLGNCVTPKKSATQIPMLSKVNIHWRLMIKISNVLIANATQAPRANVPKIANKNNRLTTLNKSQLIIE